jgi:tetraacyldisaccharide 4'-kinase
MKPPDFWMTGGLPAALLAPAGAITARLTARRVARPGWRAPVPVLCAGNPTVGGSGKTPLTLDWAARLSARGINVHILTRGHGGATHRPTRVDPNRHTAADVGDEALLLADAAPTWVGIDRAATARAAVQSGAAALLLDDGLQNATLHKDFSALVIDGGIGFSNNRLLPAGPLREPVAAAAARCQLAVMVGADRTAAAAILPISLPIMQARLAAEPDMAALAGQRVVAFAGIGRPGKFFLSLQEAGIALAETTSFPDHHVYRPREIATLRERAAALGVKLVTTWKDFVRLPASERAAIQPLGAALAWANEPAIDALLRKVVP